MQSNLIAILPILLFAVIAVGFSFSLLTVGRLFGPKRRSRVKEMPYESGMDPIHAARRRFDVRFHLVAIAFLIFDVELLFLYPWAVASKTPWDVASKSEYGIDGAVTSGLVESRGLVFAEVMVFIGLLALGLVYCWCKGLFRWR